MIDRRLLGWTFVLTALLTAGAASHQTAGPTQPVLPPEASAELDQLLEKERASNRIPGLSVAVGWRGRVVYSRGVGSADLEHGVPVTATTAFRTASVAKPMTATAVLQLVEAGKIDLDRPIQEYCPAFPKKAWPVTSRLILGHLAGIRHYKPGESAGTKNYLAIEDSLELFKNDALLHEPGTKYLYSTFAYNVLGCAIEGAARMPYEQYMRSNVWARAGMSRTRLDRIWDVVPDRARGYQLLTETAFKTLPPAAQTLAKPGEIYNAPLHDTSMKVPGGGLLSTAEDLVRFGMATFQQALVSRETRDLMWTDGKTKAGESTGYGLGWGVAPPQDGIRRLSHGGNQAGASSAIIVLPELDLVYAVMTNLEDASLPPFTRGIAQALRKYVTK